jgi:hypothetical protein
LIFEPNFKPPQAGTSIERPCQVDELQPPAKLMIFSNEFQMAQGGLPIIEAPSELRMAKRCYDS